MTFILHVDSTSTPYDVIAQIPTPEATSTHKPVAHCVIIDLIRRVATEKGYQITQEQFGLSQDGSKMFGVIDFSNTDASGAEYSYSIGFRNSHRKQLAFGMVAGARVFVCDNLCFQGDWSITRKHTSGIDPEKVVRAAFEMMPQSWVKLRTGIDKLKNQYITQAEASEIILKAAQQKILPAADAVKVYEEFLNPRHEDFRPLTKWSLYNAFTEINKSAPSMARTVGTLNGLAVLFGLTDQDINEIESSETSDSFSDDSVDEDNPLNNAEDLNKVMQLELDYGESKVVLGGNPEDRVARIDRTVLVDDSNDSDDYEDDDRDPEGFDYEDDNDNFYSNRADTF